MVKVGISPEVNALATIMLVISLFLVICSQLLAREKSNLNALTIIEWLTYLKLAIFLYIPSHLFFN